LTVNKADPPISFTDISKTYGDANFNLSASSSSTGAFTYTIADQNIATINGVAVSIESAGSTSITITQAADNNYNTASKTINLLIYKAIPIIIASNVTKTFGDLDFNLTATSSSTGAFTFNILDTNIATVTGSNTTIVGAGTTTVTVNQVADSNYYAAIATMTLTVDKADPGIGNFSPITKTFGDQSFEIIEPSKNSNNTSDFIYSSSNPLIASVTGKIITLHKAGLVSISANLPADNNFIASSVSTTLTINKVSQSISIGELPTTLPLKDFNSISLTASSTSGSPVSMSLANGSAASLNGAPGNYSLVSIQQTGLVTITFFVSENSSENYKAATVTLVVDVVKVNQNISLNTAPPNFLSFSENLSFTIDASSSSSLPISYKILSGNALINSNVLSVTGVGQIIIQLSQQGNNEFNPAPLSNFTLNVGQGNTLLSEFNISEKFVNDSPFDITPPNSNRSGEIVYTSSNPQIATISGTKITILNIGQTTITANQIATNNYKSGTISSVFIVNQIINPDFDNDGIDDPYDNCFSVPNPDQNDNDSDGIGDSCDNDDDNDGVDDLLDNCRNESNSSQDDFDNDGIGDKCDIDDDNDGYNDIDDVFPLDENEWADFDQDGIGNNEDKDDDNDNWSDEIETLCNTNPFDTQNYPGDYDSDLTPDCIDEDLDNDGYNNDLDVFPYDFSEWSDNDKDSIGDNADLDDDNDNWTDLEEIECLSDPLDSDSIPEDFDQDGDPNCFDLDDDNDGYNDTFDAFPFDSSEWSDTDLDGVGDNSDNDFNGDGLVDDKLFPTEFISPNGDGINDSWVIVNSEFFPNCEVWIYTRMGQLIYNSKRYNNDWSGLYNGQQLPESSYVYLIDKNGDGEIDQKGWIYIAR
jgi:gliding motility-associated-like protein